MLHANHHEEHFTEDGELETALRALAQPAGAEEPLPSGTRVGPYVIVALLGRGGMGLVYRARDLELERDVALKVLAEATGESSSWLLREARAAAAVAHPNVATVFDVGPSYIAMELLPGRTLRDELSLGPLPLARALAYARHIADGLAAMHRAGVVHRDVKPENIGVDAYGRPKLLDFGLATGPFADEPDGGSLARLDGSGTRGYMAPEQAAGELVDSRADVYAFGLVLGEMLGARRSETLADPEAWLRVLPARVRSIVQDCLAPSPDARPRDGADLVRRLASVSRPLCRIGAVAILRSSSQRLRDANHRRPIARGSCSRRGTSPCRR